MLPHRLTHRLIIKTQLHNIIETIKQLMRFRLLPKSTLLFHNQTRSVAAASSVVDNKTARQMADEAVRRAAY